MRLVCSIHNEDALGPFRTDSADVCCAASDCQSPGIMRPRIRRLWRRIVGICSRLLAGLCCLSWALTQTAPDDDSFVGGAGGRKAKEGGLCERKKRKTPIWKLQNIQHKNMLCFLMWHAATTETGSSIEGCQSVRQWVGWDDLPADQISWHHQTYCILSVSEKKRNGVLVSAASCF